MTQLYAICDTGWNLIRTASTAIGLTASTGKTYSNAALAKIEDLRSNFVLPIDQGILPDQEWQTVVGNPAITLNGNPQAPDTMSASLSYQTQPISIDAAKAKLEERVKQYKFSRMAGGITFDVRAVAYIVQTDEMSLALLARIAEQAKANLLSNGQIVRMTDNSSPLLSQQQIIDLNLAVCEMLCACTDAQTEREYAIDSLGDDLQAHIDFDCTAGFPAFPEATTE